MIQVNGRRVTKAILFLILIAGFGAFLGAQTPSGGYNSPASGGTTYTGTSPIVITGSVISCPTCSTSTGITLQTNGVANGSQTLLNLAGSTNVTVTDNGSGTDTIAVTGLSVAPQNTPFVANQFLTAYNSTTGAFTQSGTCGVLNTTSCVITGFGSTSGSATITWPATASVITSAIAFSNAISSAGNISAGGASGFFVGANSGFKSAANGRVNFDNNAFNTNGLTRFAFGTEVASAPAFTFDGSTDVVKTSDGTGDTTKGNFSSALFKTDTNCAISSVSPAACVGASAGQVAVPTAATTYTVNTTAVTANSEIFIQQDASATAGTRLGVTCNTTVSTALPLLTAKVAATSFTFSLTGPLTNPDCFSYHIVN